ncbi:bifunctional diguanylate cyclase/phosphodiesterase [Neptunomonas phycophila]|uniref:Bifunctional diguanylate cyclase/phosphodiesterase n=1 Tax=Neptunomonas phycophila TaxID=1572645 RepID=A0AAW7XKM9_9GAMM|nr:bifunctional diguanylate cyclase/phosphodiesterase [Neptunomonas phycophila]MBT3145376.1 bifunctional diguanylate cyclase/phosphodiesterase [Neptunomonas phycophila]MDO6453624.1 bifunctional diguanylate cyclase/phosphodiesterase [Neptunomonas phycophila]
MRYSHTLPIKVLVYCPDSSATAHLTSLLQSPTIHTQIVQSLTAVRRSLIQDSVNLLLIYDTPDNALADGAFFYQEVIDSAKPVVLVQPSISHHDGQRLLEASFADYISLNGLTQEALMRSFRLLTQAHIKEAEIHYLKETDWLTRVQNRTSFYSTLTKLINNQQVKGGATALVTVDIDNFHGFNQRMGNSAGDSIIRSLCHRLLICALNNPVYRIGGDEFAIILDVNDKTQTTAEIQKLISSLIDTLRPAFQLHGEEHILGVSIGVSVAPKHGKNPDTLLNHANQARARAKHKHGCSYSIYEPKKDPKPVFDGLIESDLWAALKYEQFALYYQPRVDLQTGAVVGAEALMRWHHPSHGLIMPTDFIPLSEKTGQIVPMGFWAIQQAGRDLKTLEKAGCYLDKLGINLSFRQFQNDYLARTIQRIIARDNIDTQVLEFELTESSLFSNDEHVRHSIEELCKTGIEFSLDDFGTGYSSFALLQKLPVSTLKIDRSFIANLPHNNDDVEIVRAIISLAHNLSMTVIAEGVETKEQLDCLKAHQCDQVQGFYYSQPVTLPHLISMINGRSIALL